MLTCDQHRKLVVSSARIGDLAHKSDMSVTEMLGDIEVPEEFKESFERLSDLYDEDNDEDNGRYLFDRFLNELLDGKHLTTDAVNQIKEL